MLVTILVTVFVLGICIFVHELGHFLAAKAVGVQVLRFSIGLGKPLLAVRRGETEYALSAIPFGGYVKMTGEDPVEALEGAAEDEKQLEEETGITIDPARRFSAKSLPARVLVIVAGPLMNMVLAAVIYICTLYFSGAQTYGTTVIAEIANPSSLPGLEQIEPFSRVTRVDGKEVTNWNELMEAIDGSKGPAVKFDLESPAGGTDYSASVSTPADSLRGRLASALQPMIEPEVGGTVPGKPAAAAGLQRGDRIVSIDGVPVKSWQEMTRIIHNSPGVTLSIEVRREGEAQPLSYSITPEKSRLPGGEGDQLKEVGLIGIRPPSPGVRIDMTLGRAVVGGASNTAYATVYIVRSLTGLVGGLVRREIPVREARDFLGGPVIIGQMAGESARSGELWAFIAILSINLGLLNLLPIPVLDGGHLLFLAIEAVRFGRPLSAKQRMRLIQVGLVIVLALMVFATANDIGRVLGL
ncbi:RIP metalloprotease RseP [bacterium]|nr:RIP metalloprotease RseP [bacterium]